MKSSNKDSAKTAAFGAQTTAGSPDIPTPGGAIRFAGGAVRGSETSRMTTQLCPLCGGVAKYETVHNPYGKRFTCSLCTEFFIDQSSEAHIESMPEVTKSEARRKLSEGAKSGGTERLFVIREPRSDELGGDGRNVAKTCMIAEYVSSKL